jgi:hypothetical protein
MYDPAPDETPKAKVKAWKVVLPVLIVLALVGGAFGTSELFRSDDGSTATSETGTSDEAKAAEWRKCMREHGVDIADPPDTGIIKANQPGVQDAVEACKALSPVSGGEPTQAVDEKTLAQTREYYKCMREHGVDIPDPDAKPDPSQAPPVGSPDDPVFAAAIAACKDKQPGGPKMEPGQK